MTGWTFSHSARPASERLSLSALSAVLDLAQDALRRGHPHLLSHGLPPPSASTNALVAYVLIEHCAELQQLIRFYNRGVELHFESPHAEGDLEYPF